MRSASSPGSTNAGTVVSNRVMDRGCTSVVESALAGQVTAESKRPVSLSPRL
jgi:hypothetical protein